MIIKCLHCFQVNEDRIALIISLSGKGNRQYSCFQIVVWYVEVSVLYISIRYGYELMVPVRYLDADLMGTLAAV